MKKLKLTALAFSILCVAVIFSCKKQSLAGEQNYSSEPTLPETAYDYDVTQNNNIATLGRVLFYDKKLSLNNSVSCGSCHRQDKAFADSKQFSAGLEEVKSTRNTPMIFPKHGRMFWDGRADSLADLVLMPIANHAEMKMEDFEALINKLKSTTYYPALFQKAYGTTDITEQKMRRAFKEFIMNFDFTNSKFSQSVSGFPGNSSSGLTGSEELGRTIFFGKGGCDNCHALTPNGYGSTNHSHNIGLDEVYVDNGVGTLTKKSFEYGQFMTPVLLNIELTAPYMHDGRFKTLEEVVEHYNSGIKNNKNLDWELKDFAQFENLTFQQILQLFDTNHNGDIDENEMPEGQPKRLNLNAAEKAGLVAFLKTLTDPNVLTDVRFSDPFRTQ